MLCFVFVADEETGLDDCITFGDYSSAIAAANAWRRRGMKTAVARQSVAEYAQWQAIQTLAKGCRQVPALLCFTLLWAILALDFAARVRAMKG